MNEHSQFLAGVLVFFMGLIGFFCLIYPIDFVLLRALIRESSATKMHKIMLRYLSGVVCINFCATIVVLLAYSSSHVWQIQLMGTLLAPIVFLCGLVFLQTYITRNFGIQSVVQLSNKHFMRLLVAIILIVVGSLIVGGLFISFWRSRGADSLVGILPALLVEGFFTFLGALALNEFLHDKVLSLKQYKQAALLTILLGCLSFGIFFLYCAMR